MMLRLACLVALTTLSACSGTWVDAKYQQPSGFATWVDAPATPYLIEPGDDISVTLPFNAELNQKVTVAPDGTFAMPLAGNIRAAGLTTTDVGHEIDKALAAHDVVADARASVSVTLYSDRIYVGGQVHSPGEVALRPDMTVMQAIIAARGMTDEARTNEVVVIRRNAQGQPMLRTVNIDALTHTGDSNQTVVLQASDTIFVPKSSIAEVDQWVDQHLNQAIPFNKSVNYSYNTNPNPNQ